MQIGGANRYNLKTTIEKIDLLSPQFISKSSKFNINKIKKGGHEFHFKKRKYKIQHFE